MNLSTDDKKTLSDMRMGRAREFLEDARANLEQNRLKTTVNRSYYAALTAVRALLILEGVDTESHPGAVTALSLRFIKPRLLPPQLVKEFKTLQSRRTDVDYGDFDSTDCEEARSSVDMAERIVEQTDTVRKRLIAEL